MPAPCSTRWPILDANGTPQPYLAESVTPNADYTVWTITMRPNLVFHNGTPATPPPWPPTSRPQQASLLTGPALTTDLEHRRSPAR